MKLFLGQGLHCLRAEVWQFSDHLLTLDPEDDLLEAFACFDEQDTGYVPVNKMRGFLSSLGDRMSEEDVI